jgi:hypothetical protein
MATQVPFVYKDSYGYRMTFTLDPTASGRLADTTALVLRISDTDGDVEERELTGDNISDRTLGVVFYDVQEGDFTEVGNYLLELIDVTPGRFIPTEVRKLKVKDILEV